MTSHCERTAETAALRRLAEADAFLFVADGGAGAGVFCGANGFAAPLARPSASTIERWRARGWLAEASTTGRAAGRGRRYRLTDRGRAAAETEEGRRLGERLKGARLNETPLAALARRRDAKGRRYLDAVEIAAGERLAADVEKAASGGATAQNWSRFLAAVDEGPRGGHAALGGASARGRLDAAMAALGPGLADVALRVCGVGQGLETVERALGWPARSGKIVLKLALGRLARHYGLIAEGADGGRRIETWRSTDLGS